MKSLSDSNLLEGQSEEITISELRSKPGEVFTQVQMGKEFAISKMGRVIAEIKKPVPFDWGALQMLRHGAAYLIAGLLFSSCVVDQYEATSAKGNHIKETYASLGGTGSIKRGDGSSYVHDHQTSFRDGAQALGAYGAAKITGNSTDIAAQQQTARDANGRVPIVTTSSTTDPVTGIVNTTQQVVQPAKALLPKIK